MRPGPLAEATQVSAQPVFLPFDKDSTVDDFLREILKLAMTAEGLRLRGATVMGGVVFRYSFSIDEIEISHSLTDPDTRH